MTSIPFVFLTLPLRFSVRFLRRGNEFEFFTVLANDLPAQLLTPHRIKPKCGHGIVPIPLPDKVSIQFSGALVTKAKVIDREMPVTALALTVGRV